MIDPAEHAELSALFLSSTKRLGCVTSELNLRGDEPAEKLQLSARRLMTTRRELLAVAMAIAADKQESLNGYYVSPILINRLQAAITAAGD